MSLFPGHTRVYTLRDGKFNKSFSCFANWGNKEEYEWGTKASEYITKTDHIGKYYEFMKSVYPHFSYSIVQENGEICIRIKQQCKGKYGELVVMGNLLRVPNEMPYFIEHLPKGLTDENFWDKWFNHPDTKKPIYNYLVAHFPMGTKMDVWPKLSASIKKLQERPANINHWFNALHV